MLRKLGKQADKWKGGLKKRDGDVGAQLKDETRNVLIKIAEAMNPSGGASSSNILEAGDSVVLQPDLTDTAAPVHARHEEEDPDFLVAVAESLGVTTTASSSTAHEPLVRIAEDFDEQRTKDGEGAAHNYSPLPPYHQGKSDEGAADIRAAMEKSLHTSSQSTITTTPGADPFATYSQPPQNHSTFVTSASTGQMLHITGGKDKFVDISKADIAKLVDSLKGSFENEIPYLISILNILCGIKDDEVVILRENHTLHVGNTDVDISTIGNEGQFIEALKESGISINTELLGLIVAEIDPHE